MDVTEFHPHSPLSIDEVYPGLFITDMDTAMNLEALEDHKIEAVLCVTNTACPEPVLDLYEVSGIRYFYIPMVDSEDFDIRFYFEITNKIIDRTIAHNVLVHCGAGISRAPTVVCAWLLASGAADSADDAIAMIRPYRRIEPNLGFYKQLQDYELELAAPE